MPEQWKDILRWASGFAACFVCGLIPYCILLLEGGKTYIGFGSGQELENKRKKLFTEVWRLVGAFSLVSLLVATTNLRHEITTFEEALFFATLSVVCTTFGPYFGWKAGVRLARKELDKG